MARDTKISAAEHCYRSLSQKIIRLELKPNEPVGEHALADLLGVSRTPVREALSRLSAEGLVDLRSRAGVVVAPIRMDAVRTAQFVREHLELAIVAEAARQSNRRILLGIRQTIEEQELAVAEDNPDLFFECDERMHALYCNLAGRDGVWGFISDAKKHMDRVRRLSLQAGQLPIHHRPQGPQWPLLRHHCEGFKPSRAPATQTLTWEREEAGALAVGCPEGVAVAC